jgi:serine/threonine protein phosphatase PrpC
VYQPWAGKDPPSTTLVAAAVRGGLATVGWVGDSRAYFVNRAGTWQLSRDDTWAADQVARGRLSESEAATDPRGRFLTRWLGNDQEGYAASSVRTFEIERPGLVLLCSDGLWNYLETPDMLGEMVVGLGGDASPATVARTLTEFARGAGGHDNITVAVAALGAAEPVGNSEDETFDTRLGWASPAAGQG